jgi:hypothetical protein
MAAKTLKAETAKLLDEADSILEKAFYEASNKMRNATDHKPGGTGKCWRCDCEFYKGGPGGGACRTSGCGHGLFSHDIL